MYLTTNTHPDMQCAVHKCVKFTHSPRKEHAVAVKKICRYLKGTRTRGLEFKPTTDLTLDMYVDNDFACLFNAEDDQDPISVKSRTGLVITLGACTITWVSKLQTLIALGMLEVEYITLSIAMRDLLPMQDMLKDVAQELKLDIKDVPNIKSMIFKDNNGCIGLALSPRITPRTKHIAVKYHWFCEHIGSEQGIMLTHVETTEQKADIFTKGLVREKIEHVRKILMGW